MRGRMGFLGFSLSLSPRNPKRGVRFLRLGSIRTSPFIPHTPTFGDIPGNPIRTSPMTRHIIITSTIVGPLVGAVAAWLVLTAYALISPAYPNSVQFLGWICLLLIAIPVGYIVGIIPSLVAGTINAGLAQSDLTLVGRLILAVPVGVITTWMVWFWLILGSPSYNLGINAAMFTAAGALGSPAAVWFAARPRRTKPAPVLA
jgi:hypothetical protein